MTTSSVNGVQISVAASGQVGGTSTKGSALFGTPQASGDFLGMLMGAFGQITPVSTTTSVTGVTNTAPIATADLLMTPVARDTAASEMPMIDAALAGSGESVDLADESFTDFLKSALNNAPEKKAVVTDLSDDTAASKTVGLPNSEWVSDNGAGGQAATNFGDRLTSQNGAQAAEQTAEILTVDESKSIIPTVTSHDDPTQDLAVQLNAMIVGGSDNKGHKDGATRNGTSSLGALSGLLTPANDTGYTPSFLMAQDGYQPPVQAQSVTSSATQGPDADFADVAMDDGSDLSNLDPSMDLSFNPTTTSDRSVSTQTTTVSVQNGTDRNGTHAVTTSHNMVQAVSVHLQSMAQNRDTRSLTLHLDPPELGKMQIKMSYGRDKSVRADVLVEMSETLRLMEQDSTTLKSALDSAGLQTDAGSLNFSLADQGAFQNSDSQAFLGNTNNNSATAAGVDDIAGFEFKSTEEWSVDPSTGITRYNIVV